MVIIYSYLKRGLNIVACVPFRYDIDDEENIRSREMVLEIEPSSNYDEIKQKILEVLDKEKMENGKSVNNSDDMSNVVTVE